MLIQRGGQERTARQGPGELVQAISGCKLLGEVQNYEFHANEPTDFDRPEFVEESAIRPLKMAKTSMLVDMEFPALTLLWPNDSRSTELMVDPKKEVITFTSGCREAIAATIRGLMVMRSSSFPYFMIHMKPPFHGARVRQALSSLTLATITRMQFAAAHYNQSARILLHGTQERLSAKERNLF
ncbi:hypothetical protein Dimus_006345 [Dionaea muscipula]